MISYFRRKLDRRPTASAELQIVGGPNAGPGPSRDVPSASAFRGPLSSFLYEHDPEDGDDLPAGTIIMKNEPFAYVLRGAFCNVLCPTCFKPFRQYRRKICPGCQEVHYCTMRCLEKGWADGHKYECQNFSGIARKWKVEGKVPWDQARLVLRILGKLQNSLEEHRDLVGPDDTRGFWDLLPHTEEFLNDPSFTRFFRRTHREVLALSMGELEILVPSFEDFVPIIGRAMINSFGIHDGEYEAVGKGFYLGASIFNHSCLPTAMVSFDGTSIVVRTVTDLPATISAAELTVEYIDIMTSKEYRQGELRKNYFFDCDCERCHVEEGVDDPELDLVQCPSCKHGLSVWEHVKCPGCEKVPSYEFRLRIAKIEKSVQKYIDRHYAGTEEGSVDNHHRKLLKNKFMFDHSLVLQTARIGFNDHYARDNLQSSCYYGSVWVEGMRQHIRVNHEVLGFYLLRLGRICLQLPPLADEGRVHMKEGIRIFGVTMGYGTPQFKQCMSRLQRPKFNWVRQYDTILRESRRAQRNRRNGNALDLSTDLDTEDCIY